MAFIKRFSKITKGGISFIGNTLGLSKLKNQNRAGLLGSIGAFTSLNNSLQVNTFPLGTTLNYLENGSNALLSLPAGSTILYAELIWGGLYKSSVNNISSAINNPIKFTTPLSTSNIVGEIETKQEFEISVSDFVVGFYTRSANVTDLVASGMNGTYSVQSVPALIEPLDDRTGQTNHAGWTLAVVYFNQNSLFRSLNLWTGGEVVSPNIGVANFTLSGFKTPSTANPSGKIFVSAQEGDAVLTGDQMLFGENNSSLSNLFGPNNPETNFFCSQINDENGILVTTGTFGTRNANASSGTNTNACRQGYDITAVDLQQKLKSEQTSAYIRLITSGDLYLPNAIGIQIDNGADTGLSTIKSVSKEVAIKGEILIYTTIATNNGSLPLTDVIFTDQIPDGSTFVENSVIIDGTNYAGLNPESGFSLGTLAPTQIKTISFQVKIN